MNTLRPLACLMLLTFAHATSAADVAIPKTPPTITIGDDGVRYVSVDTNISSWVVFHTDHEGNLDHISVSVGDITKFYWNATDGLTKGSRSEHDKLRTYIKRHTLPAFKLESDRTIDAHVGDTRYFPVVTWELVGTSGTNDRKFILKNSRGGTAIVNEHDFLFKPPTADTFRLGRKLNKIVALVEKDGAWFVPATDYYELPTKTAAK